MRFDTAAPKPKWRIGEPDFVFEMPKPYKVPATGVIDYVYMPIEDQWRQGI